VPGAQARIGLPPAAVLPGMKSAATLASLGVMLK
jgi:hypothetical protein